MPSAASAASQPAIATSRSVAAVVVAPQQPSAAVPSTVAITLTQAPLAKQNLWENGTVLVAFFALVGVLITVLAAHFRMRAELKAAATRAQAERDQSREEAARDRENSATEAHRERIATTRREVYLGAVESLARAQAFIGGLPAEDLARLDTKQQIGPLAESVSKIAVVGEMETVRRARDLFTTIQGQLFEAMGELIPLAWHKADSDFHDHEWKLAQVEIVRLLGEMRHHNESGSRDVLAMGRLTASLDIEQERADRAATARHAANLKINQIRQRHGLRVIEFSEEIALHTDDLADCIRRELGLATDLSAFRAQTVAMSSSIRASYDRLRSRMAEEAARVDGDS